MSFRVIRGDTNSLNVTFTNDVDGVRTPIDITGATVFFTVKKVGADDADDSTAVIEKQQTYHTDPTLGKTTIYLDPVDTQDLEPGVYEFDFQLKNADGAITSTIRNSMEILKDITRRSA